MLAFCTRPGAAAPPAVLETARFISHVRTLADFQQRLDLEEWPCENAICPRAYKTQPGGYGDYGGLCALWVEIEGATPSTAKMQFDPVYATITALLKKQRPAAIKSMRDDYVQRLLQREKKLQLEALEMLPKVIAAAPKIDEPSEATQRRLLIVTWWQRRTLMTS
jgi:hypothetical protein